MKWILSISAILALGFALFVGYSGNTLVLCFGFLGAALLLVFGNLDRIEEFRATRDGFTTKTRQIVERAKIVTDEARNLATVLAGITLSTVMRSGRMGGFSDKQKEEIKLRVESVLLEMGVDSQKIDLEMCDWHHFVDFDYALYILGHSTVPAGKYNSNLNLEWKALRDFDNVPTPNQIREFLKKWNFWNEELEERLIDFQYYLENRIHRRPDDWANRVQWGRLEPQEQI